MEEGADRQALQRIEAALARIDRASAQIRAASGGSGTDTNDSAGAMRGKIEDALAELDALIGELDR